MCHCGDFDVWLLYSRLQLATLYVQMGQADDALMVLESDPNSERVGEEGEGVEGDQTELFTVDQEEGATEESGSKETATQVCGEDCGLDEFVSVYVFL